MPVSVRRLVLYGMMGSGRIGLWLNEYEHSLVSALNVELIGFSNSGSYLLEEWGCGDVKVGVVGDVDLEEGLVDVRLVASRGGGDSWWLGGDDCVVVDEGCVVDELMRRCIRLQSMVYACLSR